MCEIVPVGLSEETGGCNDAEDIATTLIKSDQLFQTLFAAKRCEHCQNNGEKRMGREPKSDLRGERVIRRRNEETEII